MMRTLNIVEEEIPIRLSGIIEDSIVDGPDMRFVVFVQGCPHRCKGCQNEHTHDFQGGFMADGNKLAKLIMRKNVKKITFSGGEPFCQAEELAKIAEILRYTDYLNEVDIIVYTGYLIEDLLVMSEEDKGIYNLLSQVNYIVDGRFMEELKTMNCFFRGSSNQRIWDVTCFPNSTKFRLIERVEDYR